ncbi:YARHG domain-containing protein [Pseudobutyrivibrio ruminis]|uniref:YARHG domain-containing protein n=1 Tax=Pseudobutyrivibrio ruminis TaxID=46206 RepID=UPI000421928C|nr:YARHG domain-containing protein [Pseudobutyrivibrio ruminis]
MGEFLDLIDDVHYGMRRLFKNKKRTNGISISPNVKRWGIELGVALVVGILTGCITFGLLNKEEKSLKVSEEKAVAIEDSKTPSANEKADEQAQPEEDFSDVVITVVDPSAYAPAVADWSADQINAAISERSGYLDGNKYWPAVSSYWETTRSVTDISCYCQYLFNTDKKVYQASDFSGLAPEVIHMAKNEIYARHGYAFKDKEIYNYFMGQIWYTPSILPKDFTEDIFSETEVKNLDLLNSLDPM